jgi:sulfite exporter TauE/SafE
MILTAIILGLAGSLHCVGMCSPLVMAVSNLRSPAFRNRLIYNTGRIFVYGLLGAAVATLGLALPLSKFQNLLSLTLGVSLILISITGLKNVYIPLVSNFLSAVVRNLKILFGKFLQQKNTTGIFILGSLNGLLPCGLTFLALTYCLSLKGPLDGFNFMLLFGVGTLPVMLGLTGFFTILIRKFQINVTTITTTMMFISGCLLIVRVFIFHDTHDHTLHHHIIDVVLCQ